MPSRKTKAFALLATVIAASLAMGLLAHAGHAKPGVLSAEPYYLHYQPVADNFLQLTGVTNAGDGRLFVMERAGMIWIIDEAGNRLADPFLDIHDQVDSAFWEQGLLGLVFHPDYAQTGSFYVNYTDLNGNSNIARFQVMPNDPNVADPASEATLLVEWQPTDTHNAGDLHFGPDGYLYAAIGEGGGLDSLPNAQDGSNLLGKILRLDVDSSFPYAIPPDNPFVGDPDVRDEIWLLGLRNAWRFSFDSLTGDLFIGDVGGALYEELNWLAAGEEAGVNYGWPCREGYWDYRPEHCEPGADLRAPILIYDNPEDGCAIVGGFVYRGAQYPQMAGDYIFTDVCTGTLWRAQQDGQGEWSRQVVGGGVQGISSLGVDMAGELYATDFQSGVVYQLEAVEMGSIFLPVIESGSN